MLKEPISEKDKAVLLKRIDALSAKKFELVYRLVEELLDGDEEIDETEYLLSSKAMTERILAARKSQENKTLEEVYAVEVKSSTAK